MTNDRKQHQRHEIVRGQISFLPTTEETAAKCVLPTTEEASVSSNWDLTASKKRSV
jgi:hypothetical protein